MLSEPEYLFTTAQGNLVYIITENDDDLFFRLFIGMPGEPMQELLIDEVSRNPYSGTLYLFTSDSKVLYIPHSTSENDAPSWDRSDLITQNLASYTIDKKSNNIIITPV